MAETTELKSWQHHRATEMFHIRPKEICHRKKIEVDFFCRRGIYRVQHY